MHRAVVIALAKVVVANNILADVHDRKFLGFFFKFYFHVDEGNVDLTDALLLNSDTALHKEWIQSRMGDQVVQPGLDALFLSHLLQACLVLDLGDPDFLRADKREGGTSELYLSA
jgi:hypothetical protein